MPLYNVHIYREMRLLYTSIAADNPQAAAEIAAQKATHEAASIEDCEGNNTAALVDLYDDEYGLESVAGNIPNETLTPAQCNAFKAVQQLAEREGISVAQLAEYLANGGLVTFYNQLSAVEKWMSGYGDKTQSEMREEIRTILKGLKL